MGSKYDKWMSIKEISLMYRIPVDTLRQWCREGTVPAEIRGKHNAWHINIGELKRNAEIRYHFEEETGTGLDDEDIKEMSVFSLRMKPRK